MQNPSKMKHMYIGSFLVLLTGVITKKLMMYCKLLKRHCKIPTLPKESEPRGSRHEFMNNNFAFHESPNK